MFTTGAKAFLGAAVAALAGLFTMAFLRSDSYPAIASMGLVGLLLSFGLLGSISSYFRDNTVSAMDDAARQTAAATAQPARGNIWPLAGAAGGVLLAIGTVTDARFFIAGLVLVLATVVQWLLHAWADRASGDAAANADVRSRLAGSWEVPLGGAILAALIIWAMSRILLAGSDGKTFSISLIALSAAAVVVIAVASFYAAGMLPKKALIGVAAVGAATIFGAGLATAIVGENHHLGGEADEAREIKESRVQRPGEICDEPIDDKGEELQKLYDKKSSENVSATAGVYATFVLTDAGLELRQYKNSLEGSDTLLVDRGTSLNILFRNETSGEHRLTFTGGEASVKGEPTKIPLMYCTQAIADGEEQLVTIRLPRSSAYVEGGAYKAFVPGVEGAEVKVIVP